MSKQSRVRVTCSFVLTANLCERAIVVERDVCCRSGSKHIKRSKSRSRCCSTSQQPTSSRQKIEHQTWRTTSCKMRSNLLLSIAIGMLSTSSFISATPLGNGGVDILDGSFDNFDSSLEMFEARQLGGSADAAITAYEVCGW